MTMPEFVTRRMIEHGHAISEGLLALAEPTPAEIRYLSEIQERLLWHEIAMEAIVAEWLPEEAGRGYR